jgi:hypothetical protein
MGKNQINLKTVLSSLHVNPDIYENSICGMDLFMDSIVFCGTIFFLYANIILPFKNF